MTVNIKYFEYKHLPVHLQEISKPFSILANKIARNTKNGTLEPSEADVSLRKLLEAKDAAVRAAL